MLITAGAPGDRPALFTSCVVCLLGCRQQDACCKRLEGRACGHVHPPSSSGWGDMTRMRLGNTAAADSLTPANYLRLQSDIPTNSGRLSPANRLKSAAKPRLWYRAHARRQHALPSAHPPLELGTARAMPSPWSVYCRRSRMGGACTSCPASNPSPNALALVLLASSSSLCALIPPSCPLLLTRAASAPSGSLASRSRTARHACSGASGCIMPLVVRRRVAGTLVAWRLAA